MLKLTLVLVFAIAAISGQTLKEKVAASQKRWEDQKKAEATWPDNVRRADVGVTTTIIGPGASWPCSPLSNPNWRSHENVEAGDG